MTHRVRDIRGTQSFVRTLSSVWARPSLTALEICWRWIFGLPALLIIVSQLRKILLAATAGSLDPARLGLDKALLSDPVGALTADATGASGKLAGAMGTLLPGLQHTAVWLVPLLLSAWVVASGIGRTLVLRRAEPHLQRRVAVVMALHALRAVVLSAALAAWFWLVSVIGRGLVTGPISRAQEPDLVLYCALLIVTTLAMFTAWSFLSWPLVVAPLLAMRRAFGFGDSLRAALQLGPVRGRLAEVNLVMGIVKIALIVLAMVFSATPLPFQDVATAEFLGWWWAGVALLYILWSDFFHVARLIAYLHLVPTADTNG